MIYLLTHLGEQTNHISARHKLNIPSPPFSWTKNEGGNDQGGALLLLEGVYIHTLTLFACSYIVIVTTLTHPTLNLNLIQCNRWR